MDYTIDTLPGRLTLGRQTETGVNDIRIDMSEWLKQWPELAISIWPTRPGEEAAYPADTYMDGSAIIWRVNNADTAIAGSGTVQIMGVANEQKKLSKITTTYIASTTTDVTTDPPEAAKPWADGVAASAASAQQAAQRAEEAASEIKGISAVAQTLKPGQAATAEYADGVLVFGIPAGKQGEPGPQGEQGPKGEQGPQGEPGKDAVVDATLSQSGQAADAKATGEALAGKLDNTPGTWPAWTADEQAAARKRMGIPGDWELIERITITEEISTFIRSTEPNGNPYNFTAVVMQANFARIPSGVEYASAVYCVAYNHLSLYDYFKSREIPRSSSLWSYADCSGKCPNFNSFIASNAGASLIAGRTGFINTLATEAKCMAEVINEVRMTGLFPAGVKFTIWGVRA